MVLPERGCKLMLVLSRKKDQSIIIGDNIEISIVDIQGDVIRIGIDAPKEVSIYRKELLEEVKESNKEATQTTANLGDKLNILKAYQAEKKG